MEAAAAAMMMMAGLKFRSQTPPGILFFTDGLEACKAGRLPDSELKSNRSNLEYWYETDFIVCVLVDCGCLSVRLQNLSGCFGCCDPGFWRAAGGHSGGAARGTGLDRCASGRSALIAFRIGGAGLRQAESFPARATSIRFFAPFF
jgi:hypothetical protein